jgi:hypothetical protein
MQDGDLLRSYMYGIKHSRPRSGQLASAHPVDEGSFF